MAKVLQSLKRTSIIRAILLLFVVILGSQATRAQEFITDVMVIGGTKSETTSLKESYKAQGWTVIDKDLNADASGDYIYLLYKKASVFNADAFITEFYIKSGSISNGNPITSGGVTYNLAPFDGGSHFKGQWGDLNSNTGSNTASIHLYYTKQYINTFSAINKIYFNATSSGAVGKNGNNSSGYDLNDGAGGEYIYLHTESAEILPLTGSGTQEDPFQINNTNDWNIFARKVALAIESDEYYELRNDIEVTMPAGTQDKPFYGWFYGEDKTITVNINGSGIGTAPFVNINGATIRNLTVKGNVTSSGNHASGLVGTCSGTNPCYIINCRVLTNVRGSQYVGGIVGHGGKANLTMQNSYFGGSINGFSDYAGGLIGWCEDMTMTMRNCLFKGYISTSSGGAKFHPIACKNGSSTVKTSVSRTFYVNCSSPTDLGDNFVPGAAGALASTSSVEGSEYEVVLADGQTYYAPNYFSQKLYYATSFEDGLDGWSIVNGYTLNDPYSPGPSTGRITTSDSNTGMNLFIFFPYNQDQYLISPELNSSGRVKLSFFVKGDVNENVSFQIGCSSTTNSPDAFVWSTAHTLTLGDWTYASAIFSSGVKYVAIKNMYVNDKSYLLIDDICVEEPYPNPINLDISDLTENSVTFSWEAPDAEVLNYYWKYMKYGTDTLLGEGTTTDTSISLTGLEPSTRYAVYVMAQYANGNTSNLPGLAFTTPDPMVYLPYIQDFEEGMKGWNMYNNAGETGITSSERHEGSYSFVFDKSSSQYLRSPQIEDGKTIHLSFYAKAADASQSVTLRLYSSVDGSNARSFATITINGSTWGKATIEKLPEGTRYLFIMSGAENKIYLDDISLTDYNDEDGINSVFADDYQILLDGESPVFNLSGQQLPKVRSGINVVNGKKILIK